ncbi:hypothetical protein ANCCAN_11661 [Ancylostoma caninum]|uniref:Hexosyltransferase n=1 Tax=Ancylostoma caninum TaxID=29170 RepID=A0A368GD82_ANCCA|nr:hypothetical protein ANCCAN_11661 [Ancylostoma caninum]
MVSRVCRKVLTCLRRIALYISILLAFFGIVAVLHTTNKIEIYRRMPRASNTTEWMTVSTDSELERINTLVMRRFNDDVEFFDPLLNVRNFTNVPRQGICSSSVYLVTVHSRVNDTKTRNRWRHLYGTWQDEVHFVRVCYLHFQYKFRILFAIGNAESEEEQELINQEMEIHGDILQADLKDTYRNITLKVHFLVSLSLSKSLGI